jgi:hypothetical protein
MSCQGKLLIKARASPQCEFSAPNPPRNIIEKSCEYPVHPIASSAQAAVSYPRLIEAGFDPSRPELGSSSTPYKSRNRMVSQM